MLINATFWIGAVFGFVAAFIVFSLVLPDSWSIWLGTRRNFPIVLLPLGIIALFLGGGNLVITFGWAVYQVLGMVKVEPWVWWTVIAGVVIVILFFVTRRWHGFTLRRNKEQSV